jgi:murein DD-endopeptidase MepM/ murein hydrolase activator NlpD
MSRTLALLLAAGLLVGPPGLLLAVGALGAVAVACPTTSDQSPSTSDAGAGGEPTDVPETTRLLMPLPAGSYTLSSPYGWRTDPFTGVRTFHAGTDFAAPAGTQVLAIGDGVVQLVAYAPAEWGNYIVIAHTVDGQPVASLYGHLLDGSTLVSVGQVVHAGDWIADVGSTGRSTGPHLHLEIHPGGWGQPTVDALDWLTSHNAQGAPPAAGQAASPARCGLAATP